MNRTNGTAARALLASLVSPNELDRNAEPANMVDGLFAIARAIHRLAEVIDQHAPTGEIYDEIYEVNPKVFDGTDNEP